MTSHGGAPGSPTDVPRDTLVLISDLASVNQRIATFVLRVLDADAGRGDLPSPASGHDLGARLIDLGTALQAQFSSHASGDTDVPTDRFVPHHREHRTPWAGDRTAIYVANKD